MRIQQFVLLSVSKALAVKEGMSLLVESVFNLFIHSLIDE